MKEARVKERKQAVSEELAAKRWAPGRGSAPRALMTLSGAPLPDTEQRTRPLQVPWTGARASGARYLGGFHSAYPL